MACDVTPKMFAKNVGSEVFDTSTRTHPVPVTNPGQCHAIVTDGVAPNTRLACAEFSALLYAAPSADGGSTVSSKARAVAPASAPASAAVCACPRLSHITP